MKIEYISKVKEYLWIGFLISLVGYCTYSGSKGSDEDNKKWIPTEENIAKWEKRKNDVVNNQICDSIENDLKFAKDRLNYQCSGSYDSFVAVAKSIIPLSGLLNSIPKDYRSLDDIQPKIDYLQCKNNIVEKWKNCPVGYKPEFRK